MDENVKILVAEDQDDTRNLLKAALNTHGFEILLAENGKQAVELFNQSPTNAVIMDANMPQMDGFEAIDHIRKNPHGSQIPIIMLTALEGEEWMEKAHQSGASQFLTKPFRPKEILHCLRTLLREQEENIKKRKIEPKPKSAIAVKVQYKTKEGFLNCYLKNLMDGQSFIQSETILPLGSSFLFEISTPNSPDTFQIRGTVKWVNLYAENKGMGVSFAFENKDDEERVQKLIFGDDNPFA